MTDRQESASTVTDPAPPRPRPLAAADGVVAFNEAVNAHYRHLALAVPPPMLAAQPGQFFQLLCPGQGSGTHVLRRPMSVYRVDPAQGRVEFLYKVVGIGTRGLARLAAGDRLNLFGPLGKGFRLPAGARHVMLLARGVGLATLAPLAQSALALGTRVTAVLSAASPSLVMSAASLRSAGADVVVVTDADGSAEAERVEALLRRLVHERGCDLIATCGSARLLRLVQRLGAELGIAAQVALEEHMACGIGMCYCCVRPLRVDGRTEMRRVCHDGPVFDVREVTA